MQVEKYWSELLMVMTEDEAGHVKASEEEALLDMWTDDFFTKLLVFQERMEKRIAQIKKQNGKTNS